MSEENTNSKDSQIQEEEKTYSQKQLDAIIKRTTAKLTQDFEFRLGELESLKPKAEAYDKIKEGELTAEQKWAQEKDKLSRAIANLTKEKEAIALERRNDKVNLIKSNAMQAIVSKATKPQLVAKLIEPLLRVNDNDEVWIEDNGAHYGLEDYAVRFYQENPEFLPAPQAGAGTQRANRVSTIKQEEKVPMGQREYAAFIASKLG